MIIKLTNGIELNPILVTGGQRYVQGTNRDTLSFVFPADVSMDELDTLFTAENCESIAIMDGENEYIHNGYTIRAELKREPIVVTPATEISESVTENRVTVSMSQRTYMESQLVATQLAVEMLCMNDVETV